MKLVLIRVAAWLLSATVVVIFVLSGGLEDRNGNAVFVALLVAGVIASVIDFLCVLYMVANEESKLEEHRKALVGRSKSGAE